MNICRQLLSQATTKQSIRKLCSTLSTTESQLDNEADKLYKYLELELRGNDPAVLRSFAKFSLLTGNYLNVNGTSWALRKPQHERLTLLKAVHIYKKHRVQYEFRTYFHFLKFSHVTGSTADSMLEYFERNLPEGVALKVTKVELQTIPDHIKPPLTTEQSSSALP